VLFAPEGAKQQVLLALEGFKKKTQKTPPATIQLAKRRLKDWRDRGEKKRAAGRDKDRKSRQAISRLISRCRYRM
jgi:hypothetical protein